MGKTSMKLDKEEEFLGGKKRRRGRDSDPSSTTPQPCSKKVRLGVIAPGGKRPRRIRVYHGPRKKLKVTEGGVGAAQGWMSLRKHLGTELREKDAKPREKQGDARVGESRLILKSKRKKIECLKGHHVGTTFKLRVTPVRQKIKRGKKVGGENRGGNGRPGGEASKKCLKVSGGTRGEAFFKKTMLAQCRGRKRLRCQPSKVGGGGGREGGKKTRKIRQREKQIYRG